VASIAGEAAVRIVPSLRGFHSDVKRKLEAKRIDFDVNANAKIAGAEAKIDAFRKQQEARPVTVHVKTDWDGLKRDLAQVEHIFKRNSFSRALRLNVVVLGLDALPALAYGAAGAASSLDALGKAAFALPGLLGGALASVGTLGVGLHGVSDAFKAFGQSQKQAAQQARLIQDDNRQLANSYREYGYAVRDTIRDIQDLNAENRRSSLNVADAILGVQEAADRLRTGGQKTILDLRRDQLSYLQAVDRLAEVNTKAKRVSQDVAEANKKGVQGNEKVVDALDQINKNLEKLNTDKLEKVDEALGKVSPNMRAFIEATRGLKGEWRQLQDSVQDKLFDGLDKTIVDLAHNTMPMLENGMGRVATSYNGLIKSFATEIGSKNSTSLMDKIFGNTSVGVNKLSVGMKPFVDGILRLVKESSDFLPRLGDAGAKVGKRFDDWVTKISQDGRLDKWIDRGLDAFTSLGNIVVNVGSMLSSMSGAFDSATGNQGGFLKGIENFTKKWADLLKTPEKQTALRDYFKKTQEFIHDLKEAYRDVKPLIKDVLETAREWSLVLLKGIGGIASLSNAIEKNTGLVKPLLMLYFGYRTTKPVWEVLSNSFKAYTTLIEKASQNQTLGNLPGVQRTADNLKKWRGEAIQAANDVAAATSKANASTAKGAAKPESSASVFAQMDNEKKRRDAAGIGSSGNMSILDRQYIATTAYQQRQRQRAKDALAQWNLDERSKAAAIKAFEAANPAFSGSLPNPNADVSNARSSKAKLRKDAQRELRRRAAMEKFIGGTPTSSLNAPMQGPALPPQVLDELKNKADDTSKAIKSVGDESSKAAADVKDLGSKADTAATSVNKTGENSKKAKTEVADGGKKAKQAAKDNDALNSSASKAATAADNVGNASKTAAPKVKEIGDKAKAAANEVGDQRIGLGGRLVGLAGILGPQLGLMALIAGVSWGIQKMGEAHREAANAAKAQDDALKNLAGTLDQVTGAFTAQSYDQIAKDLQKVTPGGGFGSQEFNVLSLLPKLGMDTQQTIINAGDPTKAGAFQQDLGKLTELTRQEVEKSDVYQQNKTKFDRYGLDSNTLAKALLSDPASLAKVENAKGAMETVGNRSVPVVIPDLGKLATSLPNKDPFLTGFALNNIQMSQAQTGAGIFERNRQVGGAMPTSAGAGLFAPFNPNPQGFFIDPATLEGRAQINVKPDQATLDAWSEKGIRFQNNITAPYQVIIDPQYTDQYLQRLPGYASGGLVRGPGGPTDDKVLARVSPGEHVANASAVNYYGSDVFNALNEKKLPRFAPGGWPFPLNPANPAGPQPVTPQPSAAPVLPFVTQLVPNQWSHPRNVQGATVPNPDGGMMTDYNNNTTLAAPVKPSLIALHTSESSLGAGDLARSMRDEGKSYHYIVDKDGKTVISSVPTSLASRSVFDPGNNKTINIGMAGTFTDAAGNQRAFTREDWLSRSDQLRSTAALVAREAKANGIPAKVWTGGAEGAAGIVGHNWISDNIGVTDHRDPGPNFPWAEFQAMVDQEAAKQNAANLVPGLQQSPVAQNPMQPQAITTGPNGVVAAPGTPATQLQQGYTTPHAAYSLAALMNGRTKYKMGGFSPAEIDCSGMVSAVVNSYLGQNPFGERMNTVIEGDWLAKRGFVSGRGPEGSLRVGWYDQGGGENGHTAVTLPDGTNVESSSGVGVRMGGGAIGANADLFDHQMWLPASAFNGVVDPSMMGMAGAFMPGMQMPPGFGPLLTPGMDGLLPGGLSPDYLTGDQITSQRPETELDKMLKGWQNDPNLPQFLKPKELMSFFSSQTGQVASSLLGIGTNFLSGITGIDFNSIVGLAQNIGNAGMQAAQGWLPSYMTNPQSGDGTQSAAGTTQGLLDNLIPGGIGNLLGLGGSGGSGVDVSGASPGTDVAGGMIDGYVNGQLPLDDPAVQKAMADNGFNPGLVGGADSGSASMSEDAIRGAIDSMGSALGISKNPEAWVQAMMGAASSGSDLFTPEGNPNLGTPVQKAGAALSKAVRKWGINAAGGPDKVSFAAGGGMLGNLALLSNGEFRTNADATSHYGSALFDALNSKAIPRNAIRGFAAGGWPIPIPDPILNPPAAQGGQAAGPLPMTPPPPPEAPTGPVGPDGGAPQPEMNSAAAGAVPVPSTGGAPGPGATAPAPDPGALPGVQDALSSIGGMGASIGGGGVGLAQPGATGTEGGDVRGTLGAAPTNQDHNNPALSGAVSGAAATIGGLISMAASAASAAGGMTAPGAGAGGQVASQFIQAGSQMAGTAINSGLNILSSLLVGTATNGSTASASGVPLLPQRQPMQSGVPAISQGRVHNGDVYLTNMDEYRRTQERMDAQAAMPFIGKY